MQKGLERLFIVFALASSVVCAGLLALFFTEVGAKFIMVHVLPDAQRTFGQGGNLAADLLYEKDDPYYQTQTWAAQHKRDWALARKKLYHPFVLWRSAPLNSPTIHIDDNGFRITPGSHCSGNEPKVFVLGGSTIWGWGVPDHATVPAYLAIELAQKFDRPVCIMNMGEDGYHSLHEAVALFLELKSGNIPDFVVFVDGSSEVYIPLHNLRYTVDVPWRNLHFAFPETAAALEKSIGGVGGPPEPFFNANFLATTMPWTRILLWNFGFLDAAVRHSEYSPALDPVADQAADEFLETAHAIDRMAKAFGFQYKIFLQPLLVTGTKPRSLIEERNFARIANSERVFGTKIYERIRQAKMNQALPNLVLLDDLFDHATGERFFDRQHLIPEGNRELARAMARHISIESGPPKQKQGQSFKKAGKRKAKESA